MNILRNTLIFLLVGNTVLFADSNTDLLDAAKSKNFDKVKKALLANANIHFKDSSGYNALMHAAESGEFQIVEHLVENSADVLGKNKAGKTASTLSKEKGFSAIQSYLEKMESDIVNSKATGVITFVKGEVFDGNRRLKLGDTVLENRTIFVRKNSICDLQIKQSQSDVTIRLKENSVFTLKHQVSEGKSVFSAFVKYGGALFNVGKLNKGESLKTYSPTLVAAVRGTVYEISMDENYNTKLNTYEGSVQTRVRATEAEEDESVSNDPNIKNLVGKLEDNGQLVEKGMSLELSKDKHNEVLKKADAEKSYSRAVKKESPPTNENLSLSDPEKPKLSGIKSSEIKSKLKEADDMLVADSAKLKLTSETPEVIELLKKRREEKMVETFKPETLKAPETMRLKNGSKVSGSIYQIGSKYIVFNKDGNKSVYEKSDVLDFVYE